MEKNNIKWLGDIEVFKFYGRLFRNYSVNTFLERIDQSLNQFPPFLLNDEIKFFLKIESCIIEKLTFSLNVFISFGLNPTQSVHINLWELDQKENLFSYKSEQEIPRDSKLIAPQIFYYNFNSSRSIYKNILQFVKFIEAAFVSDEQRRGEEEKHLKLIKEYNSKNRNEE